MKTITGRFHRGDEARGFTLIELMIIVAIVAILTSIAVPAYQQYVLRAGRADAQAILMEQAQFMERYFTTNNTYVGAPLASNVSPKAGGGTTRYDISFTARTATTYAVRAVPTGPQTADSCGTLTVNETGATGAGGADCW